MFRKLLLFTLMACGFLPAQDVTFVIDATQNGSAIPEAVYGVNDLGIAGSAVVSPEILSTLADNFVV